MANRDISVGVKITGDSKNFKSAANDAQKASEKLRQKLDKTSSTGVSGFGKLSSTIKAAKLAMISFAAIATSKLISIGKELIKAASKAEGIKTAFDKLNDPKLLEDLREATRGTVDNVQLMQAALKANNFKIPLEQLATYFKFATNRAIETGESVDYLVESIINGIGRKSSLVLDNLGISAAELQEEIKKTGDFATAAGNIIERELGGMGDVADTTATKIARVTASWENFKTSLGKAIALSPTFQLILDKLDAASASLGRDIRPYQGISLETAYKTQERYRNEIDSLRKSIENKSNLSNIANDKIKELKEEIGITDTSDVQHTAAFRFTPKGKTIERINANIDNIEEWTKDINKLNKEIEEWTKKLEDLNKEIEILEGNGAGGGNGGGTGGGILTTPFKLEEGYWEAQVRAAIEYEETLNKIRAEQALTMSSYTELDAQIQEFIKINDEFLNSIQPIGEELSNLDTSALHLATTFESLFTNMSGGWENMSEAISASIQRILIKIASLIVAYTILNALTGGTFGGTMTLGNFIMKGFGLGDLTNMGNNTLPSSGSINLKSDIKGRDISLASNRYNNTLIRNT